MGRILKRNDTKPSLKRNFAFQGLFSLCSVVLPLAIYPYVTRVLQPDMLGRVSFASAFVGYFALIAGLGMPLYGMRACASHRENKDELAQIVVELTVIRILTTCVMGVILALVVFSNTQLHNDSTLYCIVGTSLMFQAIGADWYFQGLERFPYLTASKLAFKALSIGLILLFVHTPEDYCTYAAISVFSASGSCVLNALIVGCELRGVSIQRLRLARHVQPLFVFFLMSCATSLYGSLDTVVLGMLRSSADVGYYEVANKVKYGLALVSGTLWTVALPRASSYWKRGQRTELAQLVAKSLDIVWMVQIPLSVFFILMAEPTVLVLSGESYYPAIVPLQILLLCVAPIGISNIAGGQALIPSGHERWLLTCEIAGLITDLALDLALIPSFGPAGAAAAAVAAEVVVAITTVVFMKRVLASSLVHKKVLLSALVGTTLSFFAVILALRYIPAGENDLLRLVVGAGVFFAAYGLFMVLCKPVWRAALWCAKSIWYGLASKRAKQSGGYYCPCCNTYVMHMRAGNFINDPAHYCTERYRNIRQDVLCPRCGSLPRHRIEASWLEGQKVSLKGADILYFAFENSVRIWMKRNHTKVTTADLMARADLQIDIQDTGLPSQSYDYIFCNHVLEHVEDYHRALSELHRLLRPQGTLVCSFPIDERLATTYEDPAKTTEEERIACFGQYDHLRVFGRDAKQIIQAHGFSVEVVSGDDLPENILPVVGPADYDANYLFVCQKV